MTLSSNQEVVLVAVLLGMPWSSALRAVGANCSVSTPNALRKKGLLRWDRAARENRITKKGWNVFQQIRPYGVCGFQRNGAFVCTQACLPRSLETDPPRCRLHVESAS